MKKDFFLKFKDYNKELEKILEHKDFSQDVKSLLLSMFYKLEISYNDYFLVKRKCKTKEEYLENILESVKNTNSIRLITPNEPDFNELKEHGLYKIDFRLKIIEVLENEFAILSALIGMNEFQINVKEQYNLTKNSMSYLLNTAYEMEKIEVLRDFNAWSWNTAVEEIKDININLIYQNLKIILNNNIFEKAEHFDIDIINNIKQTLMEKYTKESVESFLYLIFKIALIIYTKNNTDERKRLLQEKIKIETELNELIDKRAYVENVTNEKKKLTDLLKKIDTTLNNKELLLKEYEKRNKELAEYNRIFNVSHLVEKLQKERNIVLSKIEICNKKSDPTTYLNNRNKLQQEYNFLKNIDFEENNNNVYKYIDKTQELFVKELFTQKIKNAVTISEIIDCVYELRYYNFLPYSNYKEIKDLDFIQEELERTKEILIRKLYEQKIINTISTNLENDIKIVKKIFDLKIINMENIYVQLKKNKSKYVIIFYDEKDTKDREYEMELEFNKKDKIKLNKKIKLFKTE